MNALARRYSVGSDSLYRHCKKHLPPQLRAALLAGPDLDIDLDKLRASESQSLLANLIAIRRRLFANMISRVAGQYQHVVDRRGAGDALAPFPEARQAVAAVLHQLESKSAEAVRADTRELSS
jgi:hypothetical protein